MSGSWRGLVGIIKPTRGSGSLEELIRMLPEGIGVIQLPVVHPVVAECWEIQKRLHVRQPRSGYGRLLAEMP